MQRRWDLVPPLTTLLVGPLLVVGARAAWPSPACGPDEVAAQSGPGRPEHREGGRAQLLEQGRPDGRRWPAASSGPARPSTGRARRHRDRLGVLRHGDRQDLHRVGLQPDVWTPASSSWVSMLQLSTPRPGSRRATPPSIAQSPQVIAMPKPMAERLGWPAGSRSAGTTSSIWRDHRTGGAAIADPEWGAFKLGKTNPLFSTSGLNATVATYHGRHGTFERSHAGRSPERPHVLDFVRASMQPSCTTRRPPSTSSGTCAPRTTWAEGEQYVSAILLEEKSVWDYNQGNPSGDPATLGEEAPPKTPLVAFYPVRRGAGGRPSLRDAHRRLGHRRRRDGAQAFLRFLRGPDATATVPGARVPRPRRGAGAGDQRRRTA